MGKIIERHLKVAGEKLMVSHSKDFAASFDENKAKVNEIAIVKGGKKDRNRLAGAITRLKKRELQVQRKSEMEAAQKQQMQAQMHQAA